MSYNLLLQSFTWQTSPVENVMGTNESNVSVDGNVSSSMFVGQKFYLRPILSGAAGETYEASTILRTCTAVQVLTVLGVVDTKIIFTPQSLVVWNVPAKFIWQISSDLYAPPVQQWFTGNSTPDARDDQLAAAIIAAQSQ